MILWTCPTHKPRTCSLPPLPFLHLLPPLFLPCLLRQRLTSDQKFPKVWFIHRRRRKLTSKCFALAPVRSFALVNFPYRWPALLPVSAKLDTLTVSAKTRSVGASLNTLFHHLMGNIPVVEFRSARMSLKVSWCATHCLSYFKEQPTPRLSCFRRIFTCYKIKYNLIFAKTRTSLRPSSFAPIPLPNVQPIFSIIFTDFLFLSSDHFLPRGSSPHRDLLLRSASRPIIS